MRHNFSINFYLKHSTPRKSGKYPIMLRITINKEVADVSLKTLILPEYWDKQRKRIMKTAPDAHAINTYLDEVYTTLHYYYKQELLSSRHISANQLKQRFLLIGATPPSLLELFMITYSYFPFSTLSANCCRQIKSVYPTTTSTGLFTNVSMNSARKTESMIWHWISSTDRQYMTLKFSSEQIAVYPLIPLLKCWNSYVKVYYGHINAD